LILAPMPCAGLAECGACAVPARSGWKLACLDGPVFDLRALDW
jgi:NAD(P)H-flavin reductase